MPKSAESPLGFAGDEIDQGEIAFVGNGIEPDKGGEHFLRCVGAGQ